MRQNTWGWIGLTSLVLVGAGGTVRAQDAAAGAQAPAAGAARQARQNGGPVYLSDLSVDTMSSGLKLTDEQKTKIQAILDKRAADYKTLVLPLDQQGQPGAVQEANRKRGELAQKADTDIEAVLTDDQKKMLPDYKKEVGFFRQAGLPAGLIGDMKITDEQRTKIAAQATENRRTMRQKTRAAQQSGTAMTPAQRQAMLKENQDKILALLTPEQRAMLDKYNKDHPTPAPGNPPPRQAARTRTQAATNRDHQIRVPNFLRYKTCRQSAGLYSFSLFSHCLILPRGSRICHSPMSFGRGLNSLPIPALFLLYFCWLCCPECAAARER